MNDLGKWQKPHRRFNPLMREWVQVSPHRTQRPWQGKVETAAATNQVTYDSTCYLCPGNERAGGARNPKYTSTFVFNNDYASLLPNVEHESENESGLLVAETEAGVCRVVCFSPRHDLTVPRMSVREIRKVIDVWVAQFSELEKTGWIKHVQVFENRGALMGASNPHPHCQIWANATIPNIPTRELESFRSYREEKKSCLLCDYLAFATLVPFWAVWPFETMVLSKRHLGAMDALSGTERDLLADILRRTTIRYDNVFETSFPYSMGFHQRPTDGQAHPECHFHAHYLPPLLRSAVVQKFMVGYELLATPQRDITAETAAARLVEVGEMHYLDKK